MVSVVVGSPDSEPPGRRPFQLGRVCCGSRHCSACSVGCVHSAGFCSSRGMHSAACSEINPWAGTGRRALEGELVAGSAGGAGETARRLTTTRVLRSVVPSKHTKRTQILGGEGPKRGLVPLASDENRILNRDREGAICHRSRAWMMSGTLRTGATSPANGRSGVPVPLERVCPQSGGFLSVAFAAARGGIG